MANHDDGELMYEAQMMDELVRIRLKMEYINIFHHVPPSLFQNQTKFDTNRQKTPHKS